MDTLTNIRRALAGILMHHTITAQSAQGRLALMDRTGLSADVVNNALCYGVVESAELALICQALGLDPAESLSAAIRMAMPAAGSRDGWYPSSTSTPIPTDRWLLIRCPHIRVDLHARYLPDSDRFLVGHDSVIDRADVSHWRAEPEPAALCVATEQTQPQPETYPA